MVDKNTDPEHTNISLKAPERHKLNVWIESMKSQIISENIRNPELARMAFEKLGFKVSPSSVATARVVCEFPPQRAANSVNPQSNEERIAALEKKLTELGNTICTLRGLTASTHA